MPSAWWTSRNFFFYLGLLPQEEADTTLFFMKPSSSLTMERTSWSLQYSSLEEMVTTVLRVEDFPLDQSTSILVAFVSYLETTLGVLQKMVYSHYPSLGIYYDEAYPIHLPLPTITQSNAVFPWTMYYRTSNTVSLCELLACFPNDFQGCLLPSAVRHFAIEYVMSSEPICAHQMDRQPAIRVCSVPISESNVLAEGWVFCTREYAKEHLGPWLPGKQDIQIKMINRKSIRQQIEWRLPNKDRIYFIVVK